MTSEKTISLILIIAHLNQIIAFGAVGIIPDGSTRTVVTHTEQGVDLVNIAQANQSGISRNNYEDFNVGEQGVIFNNNAGHDPVSSSRGEAVRENIMLQGEAARVIVNQVTSVRRSELLGDMEVAGTRADVIIANPNGIRVQGGRFINVDQGVLTTGRPSFTTDGAISGYHVEGGMLEFDQGGLNASETSELLLIADQLQIKGPIHAKKIRAFAGTENIRLNESGEAEALPAPDNNPHEGIGLDISSLGGMYANKIFIVSNKYGIGVNNAGEIGAQEEDLEIHSAGDLQNTGSISAEETIKISAESDLINKGILNAKTELTATLSGNTDNSGYLGAGTTLSLTTQQLNNRATGQILATGDLTLNTTRFEDEAGALTTSTGGNIELTATNGANILGSVLASGDGKNLSYRGSGADLSVGADGTLFAGGNLDLTAANLSSAGAIYTQSGSLTATLSGNTNNSGYLGAGTTLALTTEQLNNRATGQILANDDLTLDTTRFEDEAGALTTSTGGNIELTATNGANIQGSVLASGDGKNLSYRGSGADLSVGADGTLFAGGNLDLTAANLSSAGAIYTKGGSLTATLSGNTDNSGYLGAGTTLSLTTQQLTNRATGQILATGDLTLNTERFEDEAGALTTSTGGNIELTATNGANIQGSVLASGDGKNLSYRGSDADLNVGADGTLFAGGNLDLTAANLSSAGAIYTKGGSLIATLSGNTDNSGYLGAGTTLALTTQQLNNRATGQILATGDLTLNTTRFEDEAGALTTSTGGNIELTATNGANIQGSVLASGDGKNLSYRGSDADLNVGADGTLFAGGNLDLTAANLSSAGAIYTKGGSLTATLSGNTDNSGYLGAGTTLALTTKQLNNRATGQILANDDLTLNTERFEDEAGALTTSTGGNIELTATNGANIQGSVLASGDGKNLSYRGSGADLSVGADGTLFAGGNLDLTAANLFNNGSLFANTGNFTINVNNLLKNSGTLYSGNQLNSTSDRFLNQASATFSGKGLNLTTTNTATLENKGRIFSNGEDLVINTAGNLLNTGYIMGVGDGSGSVGIVRLALEGNLQQHGSLTSDGGLNIRALQIDNSKLNGVQQDAILYSKETLRLASNRFDNRSTFQSDGAIMLEALSPSESLIVHNYSDKFSAGGNFSYSGKTFQNEGELRLMGDQSHFELSDNHTIDGKITAAGNLSFNAQGEVINTGEVTAYGNLSLNSNSAGFINQNFLLSHKRLQVRSQSILNEADAGLFGVGTTGDLDLAAHNRIQNYGTLFSGRNTRLSALSGNSNLIINNYDGAYITSDQSILLGYGNLDHSGVLSGTVQKTAQKIAIENEGRISTRKNTYIHADSFTNNVEDPGLDAKERVGDVTRIEEGDSGRYGGTHNQRHGGYYVVGPGRFYVDYRDEWIEEQHFSGAVGAARPAIVSQNNLFVRTDHGENIGGTLSAANLASIDDLFQSDGTFLNKALATYRYEMKRNGRMQYSAHWYDLAFTGSRGKNPWDCDVSAPVEVNKTVLSSIGGTIQGGRVNLAITRFQNDGAWSEEAQDLPDWSGTVSEEVEAEKAERAEAEAVRKAEEERQKAADKAKRDAEFANKEEAELEEADKPSEEELEELKETEEPEEPEDLEEKEQPSFDLEPPQPVSDPDPWTPPPGFELPTGKNSLFVFNPTPESEYLYVSNPKLGRDSRSFLGTDYLLDQLKYEGRERIQRYGDSIVEQEVLLNQLLAQTGCTSISTVNDLQTEFAYLMNKAASFANQFGFKIGEKPTGEQLTALNNYIYEQKKAAHENGDYKKVEELRADFVWLEYTEIKGRKVMVPRLYLSEETRKLVKGGSVLGNDIFADVDTFNNYGGTIRGKNSVNITAKNDITNIVGEIRGDIVKLLSESGKVVNRALVMRNGDDENFKEYAHQGKIHANQDLSIIARKDINNIGSVISGQNSARLESIEGNINLESLKLRSKSTQREIDNQVFHSRKKIVTETSEEALTSEVSGGSEGLSLIAKKGNINNRAASLKTSGGDINIDAENYYSAALDLKSTKTEDTMFVGLGLKRVGFEKFSSDEKITQGVGGSVETNGGDFKLNLKKSAFIEGGSISTGGGNMEIRGTKEVDFVAAKQEREYHEESYSVGLRAGASAGIAGFKAGASIDTGKGEYTASTESGIIETPDKRDGGRVNQEGKAISDELAQAKIGIGLSTSKKDIKSTSYTNAELNLGSGGLSIITDELNENGKDISYVDLGGLNISGDEKESTVEIEAGEVRTTKYVDTYEEKAESTDTFVGVGIATSSAIADTVNSSKRLADKVKQGYEIDPGLVAGQAASDAVNLMTGDLANASSSFKIETNYSKSYTRTTSENTNEFNVGNFKIKSRSGDIDLNGVEVNAQTVSLDAAGDLDIRAAQSTSHTNSEEYNNNFSINLSASKSAMGEGVGFDYSLNGDMRKVDTKELTYTRSSINAQQVQLKSGGDTLLEGAQVASTDVELDIGGDLNVISVQDKKVEDETRANWGGSVGFNLNGNTLAAPTISVEGGGGKAWDKSAKTEARSGIIASGAIKGKVGGDLNMVGATVAGKEGSLTVDGDINSVELKDYQNKDGHFGGGGGGWSRNGAPTVNANYERVDQIKYNATQHSTLNIGGNANIEVAGTVRGTINTDLGKTQTVEQNRKIAGTSMRASSSIITDIRDAHKQRTEKLAAGLASEAVTASHSKSGADHSQHQKIASNRGGIHSLQNQVSSKSSPLLYEQKQKSEPSSQEIQRSFVEANDPQPYTLDLPAVPKIDHGQLKTKEFQKDALLTKSLEQRLQRLRAESPESSATLLSLEDRLNQLKPDGAELRSPPVADLPALDKSPAAIPTDEFGLPLITDSTGAETALIPIQEGEILEKTTLLSMPSASEANPQAINGASSGNSKGNAKSAKIKLPKSLKTTMEVSKWMAGYDKNKPSTERPNLEDLTNLQENLNKRYSQREIIETVNALDAEIMAVDTFKKTSSVPLKKRGERMKAIDTTLGKLKEAGINERQNIKEELAYKIDNYLQEEPNSWRGPSLRKLRKQISEVKSFAVQMSRLKELSGEQPALNPATTAHTLDPVTRKKINEDFNNLWEDDHLTLSDSGRLPPPEADTQAPQRVEGETHSTEQYATSKLAPVSIDAVQLQMLSTETPSGTDSTSQNSEMDLIDGLFETALSGESLFESNSDLAAPANPELLAENQIFTAEESGYVTPRESRPSDSLKPSPLLSTSPKEREISTKTKLREIPDSQFVAGGKTPYPKQRLPLSPKEIDLDINIPESQQPKDTPRPRSVAGSKTPYPESQQPKDTPRPRFVAGSKTPYPKEKLTLSSKEIDLNLKIPESQQSNDLSAAQIALDRILQDFDAILEENQDTREIAQTSSLASTPGQTSPEPTPPLFDRFNPQGLSLPTPQQVKAKEQQIIANSKKLGIKNTLSVIQGETNPKPALQSQESMGPDTGLPEDTLISRADAIKPAQVPSEIKRSDLGRMIGEGEWKAVYAVKDNDDVVVALQDHASFIDGDEHLDRQQIQDEIDDLNRLEQAGFPVVKNHGIVNVDGKYGFVMDRVPNPLELKHRGNKPKGEGYSESMFERLNSNSLSDLKLIRDKLNANPDIAMRDMQMLVKDDGHLLLHDSMIIKDEPDNKEMIEHYHKDNLLSLDLIAASINQKRPVSPEELNPAPAPPTPPKPKDLKRSEHDQELLAQESWKPTELWTVEKLKSEASVPFKRQGESFKEVLNALGRIHDENDPEKKQLRKKNLASRIDAYAQKHPGSKRNPALEVLKKQLQTNDPVEQAQLNSLYTRNAAPPELSAQIQRIPDALSPADPTSSATNPNAEGSSSYSSSLRSSGGFNPTDPGEASSPNGESSQAKGHAAKTEGHLNELSPMPAGHDEVSTVPGKQVGVDSASNTASQGFDLREHSSPNIETRNEATASETLPFQRNLNKSDLGPLLAEGESKSIYPVKGDDDYVIAYQEQITLMEGDEALEAQEMAEADRQLKKAQNTFGLPVVKGYGTATVEGRHAQVMEHVRGALPIKHQGEKSKGYNEKLLSRLNENTLGDLEKVKQAFDANPSLAMENLSLLVKPDGHFALTNVKLREKDASKTKDDSFDALRAENLEQLSLISKSTTQKKALNMRDERTLKKMEELPQINASDARLIGSGYNKKVFDGPYGYVVAKMMGDSDLTQKLSVLEREKDQLIKLKSWGIRTVDDPLLVVLDNEPALAMKKVEGALSTRNRNFGPNVNENTIKDIKDTLDKLDAHQSDVVDFQLLVGEDGHAYLNDPDGIRSRDPLQGKTGSAMNDRIEEIKRDIDTYDRSIMPKSELIAETAAFKEKKSKSFNEVIQQLDKTHAEKDAFERQTQKRLLAETIDRYLAKYPDSKRNPTLVTLKQTLGPQSNNPNAKVDLATRSNSATAKALERQENEGQASPEVPFAKKRSSAERTDKVSKPSLSRGPIMDFETSLEKSARPAESWQSSSQNLGMNWPEYRGREQAKEFIQALPKVKITNARKIGEGDFKKVYEVDNGEVVAVQKRAKKSGESEVGKELLALEKELYYLEMLQESGVKTVEKTRLVNAEGTPGLAMKKIDKAASTKDWGFGHLVNKNTLEDFSQLRTTLEEKKTDAIDLQFVVSGIDGQAYLNDPMSIAYLQDENSYLEQWTNEMHNYVDKYDKSTTSASRLRSKETLFTKGKSPSY